MTARGNLTGSTAWSAVSAVLALAAGTALAKFSDNGSDTAPDVAFTMAVMAGSLYWSVLILALRTDAAEQPRFADLVRRHVRYTLRTCAVAVAGVLAVGLAAALRGLGAPGEWAVVADGGAFSAFVLMMLRILAIVGSFPDILEARLAAAADPEPEGKPEAPRHSRLRWRRLG